MADVSAAMRDRLRVAAGQQVHRGTVPQGTPLPYIRLNVISDPRPEDLDGFEGARETRLQADCFAGSQGDARALAEAVIAAVAEPATVSGVAFGRVGIEGPTDFSEDVAGKTIYRASLDLLAWHSAA